METFGNLGKLFRRQARQKPQIIDVCVLFNEIDLLEIRIGELWNIIDRFVVIESDLTFAGRPKPFFFEAYRQRFKPFQDKISYHRFQPGQLRGARGLSPKTMAERFALEAMQRNATSKALADIDAAHEDIVVLCDVDEIPRPEAVAESAARLDTNRFCIFELRNYRGYMNSLSDRALNGVTIVGPVAARCKTVRRLGAHRVRRGKQRAGHVLERRDPRWNYIEDGGWHISSTGGPQAFWVKAQNFAHIHDPYRVVSVPEQPQAMQVFEGAISRDESTALQAQYLACDGDPRFSALSYDEFRIEQDVPKYMQRHKERFRRFFFFTDLTAVTLDHHSPQ